MKEGLAFAGVSLEGNVLPDGVLKPGSGAILCCEEMRTVPLWVDMFSGLQLPDKGSVLWSGKRLEQMHARGQIAGLSAPCVMQSNLRAWENVLLPSAYHRKEKLDHGLERLDALFAKALPEAAHLKPALERLPYELDNVRARMLALLSLVLWQPVLVVVGEFFQDLSEEEARRLASFVGWAIGQTPQAVWILIGHQRGFTPPLPSFKIISLAKA